MKISNWRKKLATTLLAGGLISPATAKAANLDQNLLVNPGFENVDTNVMGDYMAVLVLDWQGGPAFAYSHHPDVTGTPDYADGDDPPNAGNWYFSPNNNPGSDTGDWREPNGVYQDITLNAGASGTQIATGEAAIRLSAYMSSYLNDGDYGVVHVDFKNIGGTVIGSAILQDSDPGPNNVWNLNQSAGLIPAATTSMRVSIYGISSDPGRGGDGYMDNLDVQVTNAANVFLYVEVNTVTGQTAIKNQTGQAVKLDYYEITSANNALNAVGWSSLQDQNRAGFPPGNGSGNGWEEAGGSGVAVLSESYLTGNSSVANNANIGIGAAFVPGGAQNLVFKYGVVTPPVLNADFDNDGDADGADLLSWQRNLGLTGTATKAQGDANGDANVTGADLDVWKGEFNLTSGGTSTLVQGFVRYVTTGPITSVPEPGAVVLAGMGLASLARARRNRLAN